MYAIFTHERTIALPDGKLSIASLGFIVRLSG